MYMCLLEFGLISGRGAHSLVIINTSLHLHDQKGVEPVRAISNAHFLSNTTLDVGLFGAPFIKTYAKWKDGRNKNNFVNSLPQSTPGNLVTPFSPPSHPPKRIVASVYIRATRSCSPGRAVCPLKSPWARASLFLSRKRRGCFSVPDPGKKNTHARARPVYKCTGAECNLQLPWKKKNNFQWTTPR